MSPRNRSRSDPKSSGAPHWLLWGGVLVLGVLVGVMAFHALTPLEDQVGGGDLQQVDSIHHEQQTHIHGIGYDEAGDRLFIATHHGLFRLDSAAGEVGPLYQVGDLRYDLMGFSIDPHDGDRMFASGHPGPGRNLGVILSVDGGFVWDRVWDGPGGRYVDFHSMAVSPVDPDRLVGFFGGQLHFTFDGGGSWESKPGPLGGGDCWGAPCLAWDAGEPEVLWMGTRDELRRSEDAGESWQTLAEGAHAAVYAHPADGRVWSWTEAEGVVVMDDAGNRTSLGHLPGAPAPVFQFSGGPGDAEGLFAATMPGEAVYRTLDGGESWQRVI